MKSAHAAVALITLFYSSLHISPTLPVQVVPVETHQKTTDATIPPEIDVKALKDQPKNTAVNNNVKAEHDVALKKIETTNPNESNPPYLLFAISCKMGPTES